MLIHRLIIDEIKQVFDMPELNIVVVSERIEANFAIDRENSGTYNIKDQTIYVSANVDILTFVTTICHEIVHHLQVKLGHFKRYVTRRGKTYLFYRGVWYSKCPSYHLQPWEWEAYRLEGEYARYFYRNCSRKLSEGIRHHL